MQGRYFHLNILTFIAFLSHLRQHIVNIKALTYHFLLIAGCRRCYPSPFAQLD